MAITTTHYRNENSSIPLRVARGHFATNHSHTNCFIDMTYTKHRLAEARQAAQELASTFKTSTVVDSILCLDGTEVIGACMASELTKAGVRNLNAHQTIYVVTPEYILYRILMERKNRYRGHFGMPNESDAGIDAEAFEPLKLNDIDTGGQCDA